MLLAWWGSPPAFGSHIHWFSHFHWAATITAAGTAFIALGAIYAGQQLWQAKAQLIEQQKTRRTQTLVDVGRRWDDEFLLKARELVRAYLDPIELRNKVKEWGDANHPNFFQVLREPNYFEELAILAEHDAVTFDALSDMYRGTIIETYDHWAPTIEQLFWPTNPRTFKKFEALANRMRQVPLD